MNDFLPNATMTAPDNGDNPYQDLYEQPLATEQTAETNFNLVNFIETLIKMDRQYQDWLEKKIRLRRRLYR